jgi:TetR/AcrR family transcriptional repressor of nem operon
MSVAEIKERTDDPRERLLAAAKSLFCAAGYHAVGTQEICAAAGVLKGTFYHFFPSKLDLAIAVLDRFAAGARDEFAAIAAGTGDPAKRLAKIFDLDRRMVARQKAETGRVLGCLWGNFALELAASEAAASKRIAAILKDWSEAIAPAIEDLVAAGTIPDQPVAEASRAVLSLLQGSVVVAKATNDPATLTRDAKRIVGLLGG